MNIDTLKVELIDWISRLNDQQAINTLLALKKKLDVSKDKSDSKVFGSGKHLVDYVSDDFNETPEMFNGYHK